MNESIEGYMMNFSEDLSLALHICDALDAHTLERFRAHDLHVESKPDLTPVSDADKQAEHIAREILAAERPDDAIFGEEEGGSHSHEGRRWIIDPIDGTKNYVRGVPIWASLLALEIDGNIVLGAVSAPALGRRWWAERGAGAWVSENAGVSATASIARPIHTSAVKNLEDASLSFSSLSGWESREDLDRFLNLTRNVWRVRAYGDFYSYMLLAEGYLDIAGEPELEVYDMAALVPIVEEAGGRFTSRTGEEGPWGGNALASNGFLHSQLLAALGL